MKEKETGKKKVMIPIRVDTDTYNKIQDVVYDKKKKNRNYSINKYVNQLIKKNIMGE